MAILRQLPPSLWKQDAVQIAAGYDLDLVLAWEIPSLDAPCAVYKVSDLDTVEQTVDRLAADHRVVLAEPVQFFRLLENASTIEYDDPQFPLQHGARALGVAGAHKWSTGKNVRVAVVDSGVDIGHPDLRDQVVLAQNLLQGNQQGFTSDVHGTAIVGVIAARANNGEGIVGVAPDARILALKACWEERENGLQALCNTYTLARAIDLAIQQHAAVLNLSLAGPEDPILERLLKVALAKGVTVVVAVEPTGSRARSFPASVAGVLAVDSDRSGPGHSVSRTPTAKPLLVAPGVDILTTVPRGGYDFLSGSSFAAAQTSGVVALLLEARPGLTPDQVRSVVWETALELEAGDADKSSREVQACAALALLLGAKCDPGPIDQVQLSTE